MQCHYYDRKLCRSCTLIHQPYASQLADKEHMVRRTLDQAGVGQSQMDWLPSVPSAQEGFRNKAKMVVAGTVDRPTLGILDPRGRGVDLKDCPLYPPAVAQALEVIAEFSRDLRLLPYNVPKARGELKHILLTISPDAELMLRFVVRSHRQVDRIRQGLPQLHAALPSLQVVSVNVQPEHKAVIEGAEEIIVTDVDSMLMRVNHVGLWLRPRSFFQTNTEVAAALYRRARSWADHLEPRTVLDLYCGVGGFALHIARVGRTVLGVEVSADAVSAARQAAKKCVGSGDVRFEVDDATGRRVSLDSDLVVVNPPRRGLGAELTKRLEASAAEAVIYSSCNAASMARDMARMPSLVPVQGQVLDMFPHTQHYEVAVLLRRR